MPENQFDLYSVEGDVGFEELPQGNALDCWLSASTLSTASCPAGTAASVMSASTYEGGVAPGTLTQR
ncbi:thiocillin family RiPP [Streptomyces sp. NBC_01077]|nr:thiocillin family RiPP [Streptomyces sp. NBC_01077]WSV43653.1 thiocillin family RiPP [Streptomyces sp. NBC_01077]